MTKHGLFLTIPQIRFLTRLLDSAKPVYVNTVHVAGEIELIENLAIKLLAEVTDPDRYTVPDSLPQPRDNSRGYHKC